MEGQDMAIKKKVIVEKVNVKKVTEKTVLYSIKVYFKNKSDEYKAIFGKENELLKKLLSKNDKELLYSVIRDYIDAFDEVSFLVELEDIYGIALQIEYRTFQEVVTDVIRIHKLKRLKEEGKNE